MARITQLLIDLNGASIRLDIGGVVSLARDVDGKDEAAVQVDTLVEAERLESIASALKLTFRSQGPGATDALTVADFEKLLATEPGHPLSDADRGRLGYIAATPPLAPKDQPTCDRCGNPITLGYPCDTCGPVDNDVAGKHD